MTVSAALPTTRQGDGRSHNDALVGWIVWSTTASSSAASLPDPGGRYRRTLGRPDGSGRWAAWMAGALLAIFACGRYDPGGVSSPGVVARAMLLLGSPAHGADGRPLLGGRARHVRLWTRSTRPSTHRGTPTTRPALPRQERMRRRKRPRGPPSRGRSWARSTSKSAWRPSAVTSTPRPPARFHPARTVNGGPRGSPG